VAALEAGVRLRAYAVDGGEGQHPGEPPEVALWGEVVARAVEDLSFWFNLDKNDRKLAIKSARWLFNPIHDADFVTVCAFANLDPLTVRQIARRRWEERVKPEYAELSNAVWNMEVLKC
jgi:hypothetical protein